jgi:phospholipid/cholesterol/gamma-HCH transport system substrate-binding protein
MKIYKETKIGLIITLIIAAFIWGLNFLKGRDFFTTQKQYYAVFDNIGGLKKSSNVSVNGYAVGKVSSIKFFPGDVNKILVEISIDRQFKIPKKTIAEIYSSDLMGSKAVNLILGKSNETIAQYDTLASQFTGDLASLISKEITPMKEKAEHLIVSIDSVMGIIQHTFDRKTQRSIQNSIVSVEDMILDEKLKIESILSNFESITQNLNNNNKSFTNIAHNLSSISDSIATSNLKQVIAQANIALIQTNELLNNINSGKGTLGQFVNNDALYISLHKSLQSLDSLLVDVKGHPKRYIHFSVFGKKDSKM